MKHALWLVMLASLLGPRPGSGQEPPGPPPPQPRVPPDTTDLAPIPPPPPLPGERVPGRPSPGAARTVKKRLGPPKIVLGEKSESDHPSWSGAGVNKPAKFDVKATGATLTAALTGVADSHAFWGIPASTFAPIQLVQEFEIIPSDPQDPGVMVAFSGNLGGYLRTEKHSAAALRQADAVIYPVSGGPSVTLGFTSASACEGSAVPCVGESPGEPQLMPAGRYVLVMNLVLDATAGGIFRGHSVAVFAPRFNPGEWRAEAEELADLDDASYGLSVTIKATRALPDRRGQPGPHE